MWVGVDAQDESDRRLRIYRGLRVAKQGLDSVVGKLWTFIVRGLYFRLVLPCYDSFSSFGFLRVI